MVNYLGKKAYQTWNSSGTDPSLRTLTGDVTVLVELVPVPDTHPTVPLLLPNHTN